MNFQELVAQVVVDTNRPDMGFVTDGGSGEIPNAVCSAILALHAKDKFYKDIVTSQVKFDSAAYIQTIDTQALPRFKDLKYFRKNDPSFAQFQQDPTVMQPLLFYGYGGYSVPQTITAATKLIKCIDVSEIFDDYGAERLDVAYQAGSTIFIKSSTALLYGLIGYVAYPNIDQTNFGANMNSWIMNEFPYAIIYWASAKIFASIGQQEMSRAYTSQTGLVTEQVDLLMKNNIVLGGS